MAVESFGRSLLEREVNTIFDREVIRQVIVNEFLLIDGFPVIGGQNRTKRVKLCLACFKRRFGRHF
jgi:hypothetical protein